MKWRIEIVTACARGGNGKVGGTQRKNASGSAKEKVTKRGRS